MKRIILILLFVVVILMGVRAQTSYDELIIWNAVFDSSVNTISIKISSVPSGVRFHVISDSGTALGTVYQGTIPWEVHFDSGTSEVTAYQGTIPWDVSESSVYVKGSTNSYYQSQDLTSLTTYFVLQSFGFTSTGIKLTTNTTGYIEVSYDGTNIDDKVMGNAGQVLDGISQSGAYLRAETLGMNYIFVVW